MRLTNSHFSYVHRGFLLYVGAFLLLLLVFSLMSVATNRLRFPSFFFYVVIIGASYYLYQFYKKWKVIKNIKYRKEIEKRRVQIISAVVASVVVLGIRQFTSLYLGNVVFHLLFIPQLVVEMLLFPMANFYPFKEFLLVFFAPLKIIAQVWYFYVIVGVVLSIIRRIGSTQK